MLDSVAPLNKSQEQNTDETISPVKRWLLNEAPINTLHSKQDTKKYNQQLPRVLLQNNVLYRKVFDQTAASFFLQICLPKHLQREIIFRSHKTNFRSHNEIAKTLQDFRLKFYFPGYHEFIVDYIKNCLTCLHAKSVNIETITPPLQPVASEQNFPSDMLKIDSCPLLKTSNIY